MPSAACGVPQTERGGFWGLCLHGGFFGFLMILYKFRGVIAVLGFLKVLSGF